MPQDDLQAAFQKYCEFVEEEAWQKVQDVADTLDEESKDLLLEMATSDDGDMQLCGWLLLAEARDPRIVPIIAESIGDPNGDAWARLTACELIKGFATVEALPAFMSVLSEPLDREVNGGLQMCAMQALGSIDDNGARQRLRELLVDPTYDWCRDSIIESLGPLRDDVVSPQLLTIAQAPRVFGKDAAKYSATIALAAIGTPQSIVPLLEIVEAMPAGPRRRNVGMSVGYQLEIALERTDDPAFRAQLEQLIDAIYTLAKERPL